MYFFVKISRSFLTFILVSSFRDVAAVLLFREKGNFREFVALPDELMLEKIFVVTAVLSFMIGSVSASLSDGAGNACVLTGGDGSL